MGGIRKFKNRNPHKTREQHPKGGYKDIVRENAAFEAFYKAQEGLCPPEEFEAMMASLKKDLPASFRVTGFRSQATAVRDLIEGQYFTALSHVTEEKVEADGQEACPPIPPPTCLSWYPDRMAWQLSLTRKDIRRQEAYFRLHNFLVSETESGNISRQETVSMIPPLVLDVKPHHKVLDLCAAPGSKTAQLIEAIHAVEDVIPKGLVVANDSDNSRCYMLVHQAKRLQSPCVIITNHDAAIMPNIQVPNPDDQGSCVNLRFDRVLCDVPCSGDGTMRKNADIWPKWNAGNSTNLHGIQSRILRRGLELLEVGGRLVYSTCSLNPLEDEAVVHRMLMEAGVENVEVIDATDLVPGLKFMPGLATWKVGSKEGDIFTKWEDVPEKLHTQMRPHMFPPQNPQPFGLHKCMRVLPHQQDTGGFFVAVLHKKQFCNWESKQKGVPKEDGGEKNEDDRNGREPPRKKARRYHGYKEDPYLYFEDDEEVFKSIRDYFQLDGLEASMFLTRCKDTSKKNSLYYTSPLVRDIVLNNIERVKIINTGVKAFAKCENKGAICDFRLAQEGALMTIPFLRQRVIRPTRDDLEVLLTNSDVDKPPGHELMDAKTREQLEALGTGSIAIVYEEEKEGSEVKLEFVGWKGKASVRAYVPKNERIHYLRLIGADTSKYEKNKFEAKRGGCNRDVEPPSKDEETAGEEAEKNP